MLGRHEQIARSSLCMQPTAPSVALTIGGILETTLPIEQTPARKGD